MVVVAAMETVVDMKEAVAAEMEALVGPGVRAVAVANSHQAERVGMVVATWAADEAVTKVALVGKEAAGKASSHPEAQERVEEAAA